MHEILDGKIEVEGSYAELMQQGALEQLLKECEMEEKERKKIEAESDDDMHRGKYRVGKRPGPVLILKVQYLK